MHAVTLQAMAARTGQLYGGCMASCVCPVSGILTFYNHAVRALHDQPTKQRRQVLTVCDDDGQIFVEYVMLNRVNDAPETAHELGQLLRGKNMILNLIPWNPVYSPDISFDAPGAERVVAFQRIVREEYGVFCTVRQEMGQDISGTSSCACANKHTPQEFLIQTNLEENILL